MSIETFVQQLDQLAELATSTFAAAADAAELDAARVEFLGAKKGKLKALQKNMGSVPGESKKEAGMKLNAVKQAIQTAFEDAQGLSLIHISEPTRQAESRMPSSA